MASTTAGNSHIISNMTFGADAAGVDVKVFGDTTGYYLLWDASANKLISLGAIDIGVNDAGHDVIFYGDTSGSLMQWDASDDRLEFVGAGIDITGANVGIFLNANLTPDANRTYMSLALAGTRATEKDITMAASASQNLDPMQSNLNIIGSNPSSTSTLNTIYQQITHDTTDMANLRLKGADWTVTVAKNLQDAYAFQGELDIVTNSVTVGGEACAMGLTTSVTSAVTGNVWNTVMVFSTDQTMGSAATLFLSHRSTGTIGHAIYIEANSGTTLTDCLYINSAGTITNFVTFSAAAGPCSVDAGTPGANSTHKIKVDIGGVAGYIPVYTDY